MSTYISKRITAEAIQWTGDNLADIKAFAGEDFIDSNPDGRAWIYNTEGPFEIRPGYWLSRQPGQPLILHSPAAFARMWEPA